MFRAQIVNTYKTCNTEYFKFASQINSHLRKFNNIVRLKFRTSFSLQRLKLFVLNPARYYINIPSKSNKKSKELEWCFWNIKL